MSPVDGIQEVGLMETLSSAAKFCTKDSSSSPAVLQLDQNTENGNSFSCPDSVPSSPKQGQLSSPNLAHPNFSALSNSDSNMKNVGTMSYLLCNRVRVYTSLPDIEFPKGITVLQIGDNKWVAVSLEFPNEEGNWSGGVAFVNFSAKLLFVRVYFHWDMLHLQPNDLIC